MTTGDEQVLLLFTAALSPEHATEFDRMFRMMLTSTMEPVTPAVALVLFRRAMRGRPRGFLVWLGDRWTDWIGNRWAWLLGNRLAWLLEDRLQIAVGAVSVAFRVMTDESVFVSEMAMLLGVHTEQLRHAELRVLHLLKHRCNVDPVDVDAELSAYLGTPSSLFGIAGSAVWPGPLVLRHRTTGGTLV